MTSDIVWIIYFITYLHRFWAFVYTPQKLTQTNGTNHTINKIIKSKQTTILDVAHVYNSHLTFQRSTRTTTYKLFSNWIIQAISFIWTLLFHLLVIVFKCRMPANQQITLKWWAEKYKWKKKSNVEHWNDIYTNLVF